MKKISLVVPLSLALLTTSFLPSTGVESQAKEKNVTKMSTKSVTAETQFVEKYGYFVESYDYNISSNVVNSIYQIKNHIFETKVRNINFKNYYVEAVKKLGSDFKYIEVKAKQVNAKTKKSYIYTKHFDTKKYSVNSPISEFNFGFELLDGITPVTFKIVTNSGKKVSITKKKTFTTQASQNTLMIQDDLKAINGKTFEKGLFAKKIAMNLDYKKISVKIKQPNGKFSTIKGSYKNQVLNIQSNLTQVGKHYLMISVERADGIKQTETRVFYTK